MARFMDVHDGFVGVTKEQLSEAHDADLAIEAEEGVHFEKAWLDPESGKVFCLSTGPSKEAVMRIHERAGHPTTEVYELPVEVYRPDAQVAMQFVKTHGERAMYKSVALRKDCCGVRKLEPLGITLCLAARSTQYCSASTAPGS